MQAAIVLQVDNILMALRVHAHYGSTMCKYSEHHISQFEYSELVLYVSENLSLVRS